MGRLRFPSFMPRSLSGWAKLRERKGTMHCDAFPSSLRTSLHPSALGLAARSAEARGPAPWTPAEEQGPSDSQVFWHPGLPKGNASSKISGEMLPSFMRQCPFLMSQGMIVFRRQLSDPSQGK